MSGRRHAIGASSAASSTMLEIAGEQLLSFGGCNYLGLAQHPRVASALTEGLAQFGISSGASRLTTGNSAAHEQLEQDAARFLGCESALLVPDGYLANLVLAQGLESEHDLALVDERSHASIRDALRVSGATVSAYAHVDAKSAAGRLAEWRANDAVNRASRRVAIFTDGVFPQTMTVAPLPDLLELLPSGGGILVVDDSHATGVLGRSGRGTRELWGLADPRIVITSTLSKALGCFGGLIAGTRRNIDVVRECSRAYFSSSPIPPALALAGSASIREVASDPARLSRLRHNIARLRSTFAALGLSAPEHDIPVFPFTLDSSERMQRVHDALFERGILAPYVSYPDGMDDRRSYFRIALSSEHTDADIDRLSKELERALRS